MLGKIQRVEYKPVEYARVGDIRRGYFFIPCKVNYLTKIAGSYGRIRLNTIGGGEFFGAVKCKKAITLETIEYNRFIPKTEIQAKNEVMNENVDLVGSYKNIHDYWDFYIDKGNYNFNTIIQTINQNDKKEVFAGTDDIDRLLAFLPNVVITANFTYIDRYYVVATDIVKVIGELRDITKDISEL